MRYKADKYNYDRTGAEYLRGAVVADFFIFLAIILCVAFAVSAFVSLIGWKKRGDTDKIVYTVKISALSDEVAGKIGQGDAVIDSVGKYSIGTVIKTEIEEMKIEYGDGAERRNAADDVGYCNVTVFISANSTNDGSDISTDGYVIKVGKKMYIRLPYFVGEGVCTSITTPDRTE